MSAGGCTSAYSSDDVPLLLSAVGCTSAYSSIGASLRISAVGCTCAYSSDDVLLLIVAKGFYASGCMSLGFSILIIIKIQFQSDQISSNHIQT